jgi:hypothetical protein
LGNHHRLKSDLAELGVFDPRMPLYMLYRQRERAVHGFSADLRAATTACSPAFAGHGPAVDLQRLITALAFKLIAQGKITHKDIPDSVDVESERRQIFFGAALNLPTFYMKQNSRKPGTHRAAWPGKRDPGFINPP